MELSWIARHTGLPSFAFRAAKGSWYALDAQDATGRTWEAVATRATGKRQLLSDPLALPGVETTYVQRGTSNRTVLTRPKPEWWRGLVSRLDGRSVPEFAWIKNGDPRSWDSGISRFNSRVARWALETSAVEGSGVFILFEPRYAPRVEKILRSREPLLVVPGEQTPGLPPRVITVDKVSTSRISGDGHLQYSVTWSEVPLDSPMLRRPDGSAGAPVVNWGEYQAYRGGWLKNTSYEALCKQIAGMP